MYSILYVLIVKVLNAFLQCAICKFEERRLFTIIIDRLMVMVQASDSFDRFSGLRSSAQINQSPRRLPGGGRPPIDCKYF